MAWIYDSMFINATILVHGTKKHDITIRRYSITLHIFTNTAFVIFVWFQFALWLNMLRPAENPSGESNIVWKAKEFNILSTQHCWGVLSKYEVVLTFIKNVSINRDYICYVIAIRYKFDIKWNSILMTIRCHLLDNSQINFIIARVNPYFD